MSGNNKISVITVCYNAVDVIEQTIQSVLGQDYNNIEYIIIDGGSNDGTVDVIKKYSNFISYWVSEPDGGIYDAMNKGIKVSTGDFLNFMNAGDTFSCSDAVSNAVPYCEEGLVAVYGASRRVYLNGKSVTNEPSDIKKLSTDMPFCHQAVFINGPYHKSHLYDVSFKYSADYDFFYRAWKNGCRFKKIDTVVADYRFGDGASMMNYKTTILERKKSWIDEDDTMLRKIALRYYILKIYIIRMIKSFIRH